MDKKTKSLKASVVNEIEAHKKNFLKLTNNELDFEYRGTITGIPSEIIKQVAVLNRTTFHADEDNFLGYQMARITIQENFSIKIMSIK